MDLRMVFTHVFWFEFSELLESRSCWLSFLKKTPELLFLRVFILPILFPSLFLFFSCFLPPHSDSMYFVSSNSFALLPFLFAILYFTLYTYPSLDPFTRQLVCTACLSAYWESASSLVLLFFLAFPFNYKIQVYIFAEIFIYSFLLFTCVIGNPPEMTTQTYFIDYWKSLFQLELYSGIKV